MVYQQLIIGESLNTCLTSLLQTHDDVKMRLFSLSLDNDASDWFIALPANSIITMDELQ
jgi:hypothetical protein